MLTRVVFLLFALFNGSCAAPVKDKSIDTRLEKRELALSRLEQVKETEDDPVTKIATEAAEMGLELGKQQIEGAIEGNFGTAIVCNADTVSHRFHVYDGGDWLMAVVKMKPDLEPSECTVLATGTPDCVMKVYVDKVGAGGGIQKVIYKNNVYSYDGYGRNDDSKGIFKPFHGKLPKTGSKDCKKKSHE